ncbi:MAG: AI-2E family transporter [Hyphomicrobiaceae bacterium]|nr:AI-2E family transporter [Hyphomicrobiaceae bacterium]
MERQVLFWLVSAIALVGLLGLLKDILLPFVAGMLIAYGLNPLADGLERLGLPRIAASVLIVAGLLVAFVLALIFLLPVLAIQIEQFVAALPGEMQRLKGILEVWAREAFGDRYPQVQQGIDRAFASLGANWDTIAAWAAQSLWTQGRAVFNVVSIILVTPLVVFYLLVDWKRMLGEVDHWLPLDHADVLRQMGRDINASVAAFIRGQGTVCLVLGLFYAVSLWAIGLNYGVLIGLGTGLAAFVPFIGWIIGATTATALAALQFWPETVPILMVMGVFLAGQALDAGFLSPAIVGSRIGLHPVWLLFALFAFSYLFGLVGVLVAVPLAAAMGVIVRYGLRAYLASSVYRGDVAT